MPSESSDVSSKTSQTDLSEEHPAPRSCKMINRLVPGMVLGPISNIQGVCIKTLQWFMSVTTVWGIWREILDCPEVSTMRICGIGQPTIHIIQ